MYRVRDGAVEVLLAHPGGPFFRNKDEGAWSIPKGEPEPGEDLLRTAQREFEEETGIRPAGPLLPLDAHPAERRQDRPCLGVSGRLRPRRHPEQHLHDGVAAALGPPVEFPEIDRAEFFPLDAARRKIKSGQQALIDELAAMLP